jgi:inner membrane protein
MDPISHGIIGVAISSFSGAPVAINSAVTVGSMLGAMSPDLDFVIRIFKDDVKYLEHHRGFSHSIPMLLGFSIAITTLLSFVGFENFNFFQTFFWTFLGALSHTGFDILNSYGARLMQRKHKGNLLTLYDPFITMVCGILIYRHVNGINELFLAVVLIAMYLAIRLDLRERAQEALRTEFESQMQINTVIVMPALKLFYKWDFVIEGNEKNIVGQYNPFSKDPIKVVKALAVSEPELLSVVRATVLGQKFSNFSPNIHAEIILTQDDEITVRIVDLRYFFRNTFLHQATLILDKDLKPVKSIFHPYKLSKAVLVY